MKIPILFTVAVALALGSCSGSSKSSGNAARAEFKSRTGISLPASVTDWEYASVQVGDTYGEYYRFRCTRDVFLDVTAKLSLKADVPARSNGIHWGDCEVGEVNPNDPSWWVRPPNGYQQIYHKEGYSDIAYGSVMACWYDAESGLAFMSVDFWD